jgi:hypothetical protein
MSMLAEVNTALRGNEDRVDRLRLTMKYVTFRLKHLREYGVISTKRNLMLVTTLYTPPLTTDIFVFCLWGRKYSSTKKEQIIFNKIHELIRSRPRERLCCDECRKQLNNDGEALSEFFATVFIGEWLFLLCNECVEYRQGEIRAADAVQLL